MGITNGTNLLLNISAVIDLISVIVNFLGLLFFALGGFASSVVGIMILVLVINAIKPLVKDWIVGHAFQK